MPGTISQYQVVIAGQLITASLWNGMELNIINNGLIPAGIDDYSATDGEMQTATDPFPAGATSRPTSLQGELERIRYQLANITGETYWYNDPDVTIAAMKTNFDAHTHDGTSNNGPQIDTDGIADDAITRPKIGPDAISYDEIADDAIRREHIVNGEVIAGKLGSDSVSAANLASNAVVTSKIEDLAVTTGKINDLAITTAKIADSNVTTAKIADSNVTTAKIADANVTADKLAAAVAGNGLAGGAGTALSVNVDDSTIEISSDSLRVKDSGIVTAKIADTNVTEAKLAAAVVAKLGQNIGLVTIVSSSTNGDLVNYSGQGKLKGVCVQAGSNATFSVVIDGVTAFASAAVSAGEGLNWDETGIVADPAAVLNSLEILFKTSLVINKTAGSGTVKIAYERAA